MYYGKRKMSKHVLIPSTCVCVCMPWCHMRISKTVCGYFMPMCTCTTKLSRNTLSTLALEFRGYHHFLQLITLTSFFLPVCWRREKCVGGLHGILSGTPPDIHQMLLRQVLGDLHTTSHSWASAWPTERVHTQCGRSSVWTPPVIACNVSIRRSN